MEKGKSRGGSEWSTEGTVIGRHPGMEHLSLSNERTPTWDAWQGEFGRAAWQGEPELKARKVSGSRGCSLLDSRT